MVPYISAIPPICIGVFSDPKNKKAASMPDNHKIAKLSKNNTKQRMSILLKQNIGSILRYALFRPAITQAQCRSIKVLYYLGSPYIVPIGALHLINQSIHR
jgi:hypothetical protein